MKNVVAKPASTFRQHAEVSGALVDDESFYLPYTPIDFSAVEADALRFAQLIESRIEDVLGVLSEYESYEVATDEIARTLDLLHSLGENRDYFALRVGQVAAFLPKNQPLYAFSCFVVVPSLMASEVHFRIPHTMKHFLPKLLELLSVAELFPNIKISDKQRLEFLKERSCLLVEPKTGNTVPLTEVVIFTGTSTHADQLRLVFDNRTLFITNGAGHNPVVVSHDADIAKAADAVLKLQLYNQGQDCAAPNSVLVHADVYPKFRQLILGGLSSIRVGSYRDKDVRVGPITDPKELVRVQDFLIRNSEWLDPQTPGVINSLAATLEPTLICKPLAEGGNFTEMFAPIIFLQEYAEDSGLAQYFEDVHYAQNAMYVTVFGNSPYVEDLLEKSQDGVRLHYRNTVLFNTHLHAEGVERGVSPYGGYGYGASSVSIRGEIMSKPTLPQRDIYEWVALPLLHRTDLTEYKGSLKEYTGVKFRDVEKLLRLKTQEIKKTGGAPTFGRQVYMDTEELRKEGRRYVRVMESNTFHLLETPNISHIAELNLEEVDMIRSLRRLLAECSYDKVEEFNAVLFELAVKSTDTEQDNHSRRVTFFGNIYQLLLGKSSGPRLAQFLLDVDRTKVLQLLDV